MLEISGLWLLAFLIGGIPFGYIAGKLNGIDVRNEGSGNIGATNVFRVVGKGWGLGVFALDFLKAFLPLLIYRQTFVAGYSLPVEGDLFLLVAGVLTVVGHNYSPYLGFKGGKGMATSAGFLAGLIPWSLLVCFSAWLVVFLSTRYVSLASIIAGIALPIGTWIFYPSQWWLFAASLFLGVMSVWRHRSNIQKLRAGTEHRFGKPKVSASEAETESEDTAS
ncbi:MAG: glycerol-3-phosphate 1-O-acyltransferase PlsY [Gammaproteobacteria bacterium]|nr:glycerol-3-phosphate 1-O-acyltransferase PlsY [Gammaproteobacteria bacterium]